jgi:hypothetical protein
MRWLILTGKSDRALSESYCSKYDYRVLGHAILEIGGINWDKTHGSLTEIEIGFDVQNNAYGFLFKIPVDGNEELYFVRNPHCFYGPDHNLLKVTHGWAVSRIDLHKYEIMKGNYEARLDHYGNSFIFNVEHEVHIDPNGNRKVFKTIHCNHHYRLLKFIGPFLIPEEYLFWLSVTQLPAEWNFCDEVSKQGRLYRCPEQPPCLISKYLSIYSSYGPALEVMSRGKFPIRASE